jgi:inosine-uridine nucleoside N-ribohydrolase
VGPWRAATGRAAAESNIVTDPEAAHIVFGERWPVTMVGLALATPEVVYRIAALGTAPTPQDCHTQVAVDLDHVRFWDLIIDALERIGEP